MYDELSKCYKVHFIGIIVKGQRYTISRDVRHIVIVVATSTSITNNKPDENKKNVKNRHMYTEASDQNERHKACDVFAEMFMKAKRGGAWRQTRECVTHPT